MKMLDLFVMNILYLLITNITYIVIQSTKEARCTYKVMAQMETKKYSYWFSLSLPVKIVFSTPFTVLNPNKEPISERAQGSPCI